jgi:tRNA(adenine34) deaminase
VTPDPHSENPEGDATRPPAEHSASDEAFMALALEEARRAFDLDEVPVGAVVVRAGRVLARAHNRTRAHRDPSAHAELLALVRACRATGDLRLPGATVYTTVEPCFMCAGALLHARVERVVWAIRDPKFGACASLAEVLGDPRLNHRALVREGVGADAARALLQSFFRSKRETVRRDRD